MLFALWLARLALLPFTDLAAADAPSARVVAELWRLAIWLVVPLVWVLAVERLDPRLAIDQRPGTKVQFAWLAAIVATFAARFVDVQAGADWIAIPPVSGTGLLTGTVSLLFASLCDEFVFRGLVLKALRRLFSFWPANALAAFFYAAMLVPGWIAMAEFEAGTFAYLFVSVFLFAGLLGWLVRLSGTIWVAVAAHFLNDFLQGFGFPG